MCGEERKPEAGRANNVLAWWPNAPSSAEVVRIQLSPWIGSVVDAAAALRKAHRVYLTVFCRLVNKREEAMPTLTIEGKAKSKLSQLLSQTDVG